MTRKEIRKRFEPLIQELCKSLADSHAEMKLHWKQERRRMGKCPCGKFLQLNARTGKFFYRCVDCRRMQVMQQRAVRLERKGLAI